MQAGTALSQNYTLPSVLFDSLVFEVRKGRSCDSLNTLNERLIKSQGIQLVNYKELVKTSDGKIAALEALIFNYKESKELLTQQFALDKSKLEKKIKKRNKLIIGEGGIILLLLIVLI